jgi:hypothetical protein
MLLEGDRIRLTRERWARACWEVMAFAMRMRAALVCRPAAVAQRRSMSLLRTIFGIGEFEGQRNQSLRGTTNKTHAYNLALLEVLHLRY